LIKKDLENLVVGSSQFYSLDRCIKCLAVMNIGQKCFSTVVLKKPQPGNSNRQF
jgi:hypothetical protein